MTDEELSQRIFRIQEHILETIKAYGDISQFKEDVLNVIHFLLDNELTQEEMTAISICEKNRYYMIQTEQRKRLEQQITELQMNLLDKDNRIKELEKAVEKRGEIIDRMADYMITGLDDTAFNIICKKRNCSYKFYDNRKTSRRDCENCIKKYFEKKEG